MPGGRPSEADLRFEWVRKVDVPVIERVLGTFACREKAFAGNKGGHMRVWKT